MNKLITKIINLILGRECHYLTNGTSLLPEKLDEESEEKVLRAVKNGEARFS